MVEIDEGVDFCSTMQLGQEPSSFIGHEILVMV